MARAGTMRRTANRRGTVLIEFCAVIPLLATVLGLTFFFGYTMMNQNRTKMACRYATWRSVHNNEAQADGNAQAWTLYPIINGVTWTQNPGNPTPVPNGGFYVDNAAKRQQYIDDYNKVNVVAFDTLLLNEWFFDKRAIALDINYGGGPDDTLKKLVEYCADSGHGGTPDAGDFADRTVLRTFDHGRSGAVTSRMPHEGFFAQFSGSIVSDHTRDGSSWRRGLVSYQVPIRDQFLTGLDSAASAIANPALRQAVQNLYMRDW